jgi:hypothetical protein
MSLDEIVNEIIRLIKTRDELGGHFQQEPYKGDFFRLFVAAFPAGDGRQCYEAALGNV